MSLLKQPFVTQRLVIATARKLGPVLKQFDGEILAFGPWQLLFGEPAYRNGMIIRFPDKDTALAWYNSPAYQALLNIRDAALDSRFRLVG